MDIKQAQAIDRSESSRLRSRPLGDACKDGIPLSYYNASAHPGLMAASDRCQGFEDVTHHNEEVKAAANEIESGILEPEQVKVLSAQLHAPLC